MIIHPIFDLWTKRKIVPKKLYRDQLVMHGQRRGLEFHEFNL